MRHRRTRYQQGYLKTEPRKKGPDVWVYRCRERRAGHSVNRKVILGTVNELSKTKAQRKAVGYEQKANASTAPAGDSLLTVAGLAEHYSERELDEKSNKVVKVHKAYRYILNNYIRFVVPMLHCYSQRKQI
jgi:integrase